MAKHLIIISSSAVLTLTVGIADAGTITDKSGNSTSTITQEGGTNVKRRVTKTPDGQTIIQESGGNKATVIQKNTSGRGCPEKPAAKSTDNKDRKNSTAESASEDCSKISEPKDFGPGFERAQALKEKMDAMRKR